MKKEKDNLMRCFDMNVDTNVRIEAISVKLEQMSRIDLVDDERRRESYQKEDDLFSQIVKEVEKTGNNNLHNLFMQYIELRRKERKKELYIESLDDTMINNIMEYLKKTEEDFFNKQHQLELGYIKENILKGSEEK